MKNIQEFLFELSNLDIKLWIEPSEAMRENKRLRCNAPEGTLTPYIRAELAKRKAEIIIFLRQVNTNLNLPTILPISQATAEIPLSFAQERLWFLDRLEGENATYNIPAAVRITGNLNITAFTQAFTTIVNRHEVLRTSFSTINGTPIQVIQPEATFTIEVVDLQHLAVADREPVLTQQLQALATGAFNLETAPLLRGSLFQLTDTESVFGLTMHHIVSDGWSMGILIQELAVLYRAFSEGEPSPLPALPIQYADFAVWQRQWLSGAVLETQLDYWRSQLQSAPALLQLPTDRIRPSVQTFAGKTHSFTLSRDLTHQIHQLSQGSGTTLFTVGSLI